MDWTLSQKIPDQKFSFRPVFDQENTPNHIEVRMSTKNRDELIRMDANENEGVCKSSPTCPDIETVRQIKCRKIKGFRGWVVYNYNAYYNKFVSWYEEIYAQLTDCCKSCEWNLTIWVTIKYVNRRRAHLFLSGLDYYKSNPPGNVKSSENNQHFVMTCGGFVILFGSIYVETRNRSELAISINLLIIP